MSDVVAAATVVCCLFGSTRAEEEDMLSQASDEPTQQELSIVAVCLLTVAPVLLVTCICRYYQAASALLLVLSDYAKFVLLTARTGIISSAAAQPSLKPTAAGEAAASAAEAHPTKVNVHEWLETATMGANLPAKTSSGSSSEECDVSDLSNSRIQTPEGPEPQDAPPPETPSEIICSSSPVQVTDETGFEDAVAGPAEFEASPHRAAVETPVDSRVNSNLVDATAERALGQELCLAAGCEPAPTLVAPTPHAEGVRKRRKTPVGCGMLSRPRQD